MSRGMNPRLRWALLLALFGAAAWLAVFGDKTPPGQATRSAQSAARPDRPTDGDTAPRRQPVAAAKGLAAEAGVPIEPLVPRHDLLPPSEPAGRRDLFESPPVPPPPAPVAVAAPAPVAPPLPFRYIGKKLEGGVWQVFLGRDDASYLVQVGNVLESTYRVDKIEPPSLVLTHLPTRQAQTLAIGDAW